MKQNIAGEFVIFEDKVRKPYKFTSNLWKIFCEKIRPSESMVKRIISQ